MRLIGYYLVHTVVNSIKKLFRTWVAFMILFIVLCGVIGGLFGAMMATVFDDDTTEAIVAEGEIADDAALSEYIGEESGDENPSEEEPEFQVSWEWSAPEAVAGLQPIQILAAAVFVLTVGLCLIGIYTGNKSGSAIFFMADVNFLFTSPMLPQSVLTFRLMMKVGAVILSALYLLAQIPNLINAGLSGFAIAMLFVAYVLILLLVQVVSVATYCLLSLGKGRLHDYGHYIVIAVLLVMAGLVLMRCGGDFSQALPVAVKLYSAPALQWIPIVGWITGFAVAAAQGRMLAAAVFLVLSIAGMIAVLLLLRRLPVDFYEDALPAAEMNQQALERQAAGKTNREQAPRKRSKLAQKLAGSREGFTRGSGAQMFLIRNLYHRLHSAPLGLFTATCVTYTIAGFGYTALMVLLVKANTVVPFLIGMAVVIFIRALANPLQEETARDFLYLVPEPAWKKLGYSLLSGVIDNALNVLPGWIVICIFLRPGILLALVGFLFMAATDLFFSVLAGFTSLIVPTGLADLVRQMIQMILFSVFVLVLMGAVLAGALLGGAAGALVGCMIAELALAVILFLPCPAFITYGRK